MINILYVSMLFAQSALIQLYEHFWRKRHILVVALEFESLKKQVEKWFDLTCEVWIFRHLCILYLMQFAELWDETLDPGLGQDWLQPQVLLVAEVDQAVENLGKWDGYICCER